MAYGLTQTVYIVNGKEITKPVFEALPIVDAEDAIVVFGRVKNPPDGQAWLLGQSRRTGLPVKQRVTTFDAAWERLRWIVLNAW